MIRALVRLVCLIWLASLPALAFAQDFGFDAPAGVNDKQAPALIRDLADRIVPVYQDPDDERYLANMAALQMATGSYAAAYDTAQKLHERQREAPGERSVDRAVLYEIYAQARSIEVLENKPFEQAFGEAFRNVVPRLTNPEAAAVMARLTTPLPDLVPPLERLFEQARTRGAVSQSEALELVRRYVAYEAHRRFGMLIPALEVAEDRRRFVAEDTVIRTRSGAELRVHLVRPSNAGPGPLPALLEFGIDLGHDEAKLAAAHGYVGVSAYARGRGSDTPGARVLPFRYDGDDALAVIAWITAQSWSDQRVAMIGEGYSGFAAWAAARRAPAALKAIVTDSPMMPGIDLPTAGRVAQNQALRWLNQNGVPRPPPRYPNDDLKWNTLDRIWYASGKPYVDLDRVFFGKPDGIFRVWMTHPSFDAYWKRIAPSGKQFEQINLPVLTMAGYYGGEAGALYYFGEHLRANPRADHTLLIGPYDGRDVERGLPPPVLRGYTLDVNALVDRRELRFAWLDHVLRRAPRPPLLTDGVNYQLMGSNEWRHAPSLASMANGTLRFHLDAAAAVDRPPMMPAPAPAATSELDQTIDFADRSDAGWIPPDSIQSRGLPVHHDITFLGDPLPQPLEVSGVVSGLLDFTINKHDVDLVVTLYELTADGDYVQLFDPYVFRASYARDPSKRQPLRVGQRQQLPFTAERVTSRRLATGSRLLVVLGVNKRQDQQINYGSGLDVKSESIANARLPMKIRWYDSSYLEIPVRR